MVHLSERCERLKTIPLEDTFHTYQTYRHLLHLLHILPHLPQLLAHLPHMHPHPQMEMRDMSASLAEMSWRHGHLCKRWLISRWICISRRPLGRPIQLRIHLLISAGISSISDFSDM